MRSHLPVRPIWLCRECAQPWPCGKARLILSAEYLSDRVALSVYMASMLGDAAEDLRKLNPEPDLDHGLLFARFLGWTKAANDPERFDLMADTSEKQAGRACLICGHQGSGLLGGYGTKEDLVICGNGIGCGRTGEQVIAANQQ
ncbi:hypothetical protein [Micromonospora sp. NPDC005113]